MIALSKSDKHYIIEQVGVVAFVILSFVLLTLEQNMQLMIVAAFGHFLIGHYYQIKKNKPTIMKAVFFLIAIIACFAFTKSNPALGLLVVTVAFTFHGYFDEHYIMGKKIDGLSYYFLFMIVITHGVRFGLTMYGIELGPLYDQWLIVSLILFFAYGAYQIKKKEFQFNPCLFLMMFLHVCFVALYFNAAAPDPNLIFRSIIIFHGARWYLFLGRKYFAENKQKFKVYMRDITVGNILIIGFYILYNMYPQKLWLLGFLVYSGTAYYAWAMVHILSTIRLADYKLSWLQPALKRLGT